MPNPFEVFFLNNNFPFFKVSRNIRKHRTDSTRFQFAFDRYLAISSTSNPPLTPF